MESRRECEESMRNEEEKKSSWRSALKLATETWEGGAKVVRA